ncbi:hypothetical protein [Streptomyces sp. NPDC001070]
MAEVLRVQRRRFELWRAPLFFVAVTVAVIAGILVLVPGAAADPAGALGTAAGGGVGVLGGRSLAD